MYDRRTGRQADFDLHGFEEASRALYAGDRVRVDELTAEWPPDVRLQMREMLGDDAADATAGE